MTGPSDTDSTKPPTKTAATPWRSAVTAKRAIAEPAPIAAQLPRQVRKHALTQRKLDDLAKQRLTKPVDCSDSTVTGLVARIRPSGTVSYFFRWRNNGKADKIKLDASSLDEARNRALEARSARSIGRDPRATQAAFSGETALTLAEAVPRYIEALERKSRAPTYIANVLAMFANHVLPTLGRNRLLDLTRTDITNLYDAVGRKKSNRGKTPDSTVTTLPNRIHSQIVALLNWADKKGLRAGASALHLERPVEEEPSERRHRNGTKIILSLDQMAHLWLAVDGEPMHIRNLVRLLLLVPMRREEITRLSWAEVLDLFEDKAVVSLDRSGFDGPRFDMPPPRMKGRRRQIIPLAPYALALVRELYSLRGADVLFVFSTKAGRKAFAGWRDLASRLRERCPDLSTGWDIHLLRTATSTAMGNILDVEPAVIARLLHHSLDAKLGITAVYDQSRRCIPMLAALTEWEVLLLQAVDLEKKRRNGTIATVTTIIGR